MINRGDLLFFALVMLGLTTWSGCGGQKGPQRYELSGTVTYNGQPVPMGYLTFTPDKSKGNNGPGSHADIRNGQYCTPDGKGPVGGPHVVMISGFDGSNNGGSNPLGLPIFKPTQVKVDLPREKTTYDFKVPLK